ncbi:MAG: 50S ribosomal protein L23 [Candidatus Neptunochlamydia sp.]|nr:50S ribosomal protein L23 [Candidatus Neptunochlamydia sp.]
MKDRNPFHVIKSRHITEKSTVLEGLQHSTSNKCTAKCSNPKYVFIIDKRANKIEVARALESIYSEKKIKVKAVNTLNMKPKKRRVRGYKGFRPAVKKAIVTLEGGDSIDEVV